MEQIKDISKISIEADYDIIFTTVAKYKLFMSYGKIGMDAYLLYSHLMFTARLQKTNKVFANNTYLRQGLNWSKEKLQKAKNLLYDLNLIKTKQRKDKAGKFCGNYIEVQTKTSPFEFTGGMENRTPVSGGKCLNEKDKCLNNSSKEELNDSEESKKSSPKKNRQKIKNHDLISYWNNLSHTRKHNSTKIIKKIDDLINDLKKGFFVLSKYYLWDKEFLQRNKIDKFVLTKKWTDEEIKNIFNKINDMYRPEYWPRDKTRLSRDLPTIIYNDITQKSIFLMCVNKPPELLKKKTKPKNIKVYNKYQKLFKTKDQKFIKMFNEFYDKAVKILSEVEPYYRHTSFYNHLGNKNHVEIFFDFHLDWLQQQTSLFPGLMKGRPWQDFKNYVFESFGFILEPTEKEKEKIIREYERSCRRIESRRK